VESVITEEGITDLKTDNIPFWTTITKFMQSFESEHKVGIYYFKKTIILDQKWGTSDTITYNDPVYKFPVRLRAYGNYSFQIQNPGYFFQNVVGGVESFLIENFRTMMSSRIMEPLSDYFAEAKINYSEIDAQREEISEGIEAKLQKDFETLGFSINDFRIEGTNFDDETEQRIERISNVQADAIAAQAAGLNYAQLQQLDAMKDAAKNEGGGAGIGMGLGAGIGFGNMMAGAMMNPATGNPAPGQPGAAASQTPGGAPPAADPNDPMVKIQKLKQMLDGGLITQEEFDAKKKDILSSM